MPFYQPGTSKLKMVSLMPPNEENITWHSPLWQNDWHNNKIITGMLRRFKNQEAAKRVIVYQFYENGELIYEIKRP